MSRLPTSGHQYATQNSSNERNRQKEFAQFLKLEMEDEYHFLNICPAYQEKRCSLLDCLVKEYLFGIKISRMSPNKNRKTNSKTCIRML